MAPVTSEMLRDRFRGCLVGLAVGDALGMPVETMTRDEILAATDGRGVMGYLAPLQKRFHSTTRLKPGQWTDDTQLSLAIARSLVRKRGFDLADIAAEHVVEYHGLRRGWGGSTTRGIREFAEDKREPGEPVLDPKAHGLGNGVAMKIAPLALLYARVPLRPSDLSEFVQQTEMLASLTHRDPCATIGAVVIGERIIAVMTMTDLLGEEFAVDDQVPLCRQHGSLIERTLDVIFGWQPGVERFADTHTASSDVRESVPFVCGVTCFNSEFCEGVLAAVNAGGDTDSNAAMVGAILGAANGLSAIPREWVEGLEAHEEIIAIADQLFALATEKEKS